MKRFSFSSLRVRLLSLVLLGVIPALGFILYTGWSQRQVAARLMQDNAIRVARLAALEQDQLIDRTRHMLEALAQLPAVRNRDARGSIPILRKIQNENQPVYAVFGLVDLNGDVLFTSVPFAGKVNLKDRVYFQRAMETQGFSVGTYQIGRITQKATINFAYPVYDLQGRFTSVLYTAVDLDWLGQMITDAQLPPETNVYVVERNRTILACYPKVDAWIGKQLPIQTLLEALGRETEGTRQTAGIDGDERLYAFTRLGSHRDMAELSVVVGIPVKIAYAEVNRGVRRNLIGLAVAVALALLAAWLGGDAIVLRPVRSLVRATRRLAGGDLNARTGLDYGGGELGELARAFDDMAAALQTRVAQRERAERELKALNEVLELRVEERTQELQEKTYQMEADLEMARELQLAFLPNRLSGSMGLSSASGNTLNFFHRYHPTGKVGGDFFDVLRLSDGRVGVFICDVMGQGIRAALVTAIVRGLVEELKPIAQQAGSFLTAINRGLIAVFRQTETPMFASAFYLIVDPENGRTEYANAGHPSPLHLRQNNCEVLPLHNTLESREPALGLIEHFDYPEYQAMLNHGDLIVLFTDGLFEVDGPQEEEYGQERLLGAVSQRIMLPPLVLFDEVITEIQQYAATHEFSDDVCIIGLQLVQRVPARSDARNA